MAQGEIASELTAIAEWRKAMLGRALWLCLILLTGALLVSFAMPLLERKVFVAAIFPGWLLVAATALWPNAPVRVRGIALMLGVLTVAVGSVARLGFQAVNAFCAHLTLVAAVALFMGRRAAWLVWGLGLLGWFVVAAVSLQNGPPTQALFELSDVRDWARVLGIYAMISAGSVAVLAYVSEYMEGALRRSEALRAELTEESSRRIAALEERRALEEQLRQSQKLEALGTLAGGVAHDFNNLLVVIINHAELAAQQSKSEAVRESLAQIEKAGERAASLTRQLLAFGRRQVAKRSALDVNARVGDSLRMLARLLPETIELKHELNARVARVWAAEVELDQIIMNLCVNARDAMPDGGQLWIRTSSARRSAPGEAEVRDFVCIHIVDSGVGMDEATKKRIFEPFFTTKSAGHGTGLGLSTVHGLVEQAHGFIEVDSSLGTGTEVRVYLPAFEGVLPAERASPAQTALHGHETILVADDDPEVRSVLTRRLQDNGYRVIACQDGEEALREFRKRSEEIALVISDAVMPKLGGGELHRAVQSEFGEIPFLICSGYAAQTLEPEFFDHPLRAFLAKPFNELGLLTRVRGLLDVAQSMRKTAAAKSAFAAPEPVTT